MMETLRYGKEHSVREVEQFLRARPTDSEAIKLRTAVLTNEIFVDEAKLAMSDREHEVLAIVALRQGHMDAEAIAASIWPDADICESLKALRVYISRLRKLLSQPELIASVQNGYRINGTISVDLWEIDSQLRDHRVADGDTPVEELELLYRRLRSFFERQGRRSIRWSWFAPVELQIDSYRREVGLHLGQKLLAAGRIYEAHRVAEQLVVADPLCELSRALSIKAALALKNYGFALRQYRSFESILRQELHAQPSPGLHCLLAAYL